MKSQIRNFMITAGAAAILTVPALTAQTALEKAEVPFDFTVGAKTMTAGNYSVSTISNRAVILLHNEDTKESMILGSTIRGDEKNKSVLAFRCYGDRCFLSEIDVPGTPSYILKQDRLENQAAKTNGQATMAFVTMASR